MDGAKGHIVMTLDWMPLGQTYPLHHYEKWNAYLYGAVSTLLRKIWASKYPMFGHYKNI